MLRSAKYHKRQPKCDWIYKYIYKIDNIIVLNVISPVEHHTISNVKNTIIVNFYSSVAVLEREENDARNETKAKME